jgi:hypothetical protein
MPTITEAKKRLTGIKGHVAIAIWERSDIFDRAEHLGIKISDKDADDILDYIDRKQDSELGITWDTLDVYIQDHFAEPY